MTGGRLHLLGQAAFCFEQAGRLADAARCRERAGEPVAAADLYAREGDLAAAARCYERAGMTAEAARCMLVLGRPADAAEMWRRARDHLEEGWLLVSAARRPAAARQALRNVTPTRAGTLLRHRIAETLCEAQEGRAQPLVTVLREAAERLSEIKPASDRSRVVLWAVEAADQIGRPDLGAELFAAAHRSGQRGVTERWRAWARTALGGTAGIPDRDA